MEKSNFKLSEELSDLIESSKEDALKLGHKELSLEVVLRNMILKYMYKSSSEGLENKFLWEALQDLSPDERVQLNSDCDRLVRSSSIPSSIPTSKYFNPDAITLSTELENVFNRCNSANEMTQTKMKLDVPREIDTSHFLISALFEDHNNLVSILDTKYGIHKERILAEDMKNMMKGLFGGKGELKEKRIMSQEDEDSAEERFERAGERDAIHTRKVDPNTDTPVLDEHGIDMTANAKEGKYDNVIGREKELKQLTEILCCRKKNNAMILADAGVGKTALVEYLAQKIVSGDVPRELKGKRVISLSTTNLTAGCMYRGQLEKKVQDLCEEAAAHREIILYVDEFQSATSDGSSSIAQMLKPSLSRGELTLIASTTVDEYKKFIEKDGALKRRFQKVYLNEPGNEETFQILQGLAPKYGEFHKVTYSDEVLHACVDWSSKYLYDRHSPDRAIDLMDVAGSYTKLENPVDDTALNALEKQVAKLVDEKVKAIEEARFEDAAKIRDEEKILNEQIEKERAIVSSSAESSRIPVTLECVASVVSAISNVPVDKIINPELEKLRLMKESLNKQIIGQQEAIESATKLLSKQFLGIRDENIPPSLVFLGSTGCGKTLLAEKIAETVYGSKDAMLRVDCGELSQSHSVTKLLGAPPSYVGFNDVALFDSIRERPNQVVLIDEFDKLAPEIMNTVFLNIMTTGFVTLNNGIKVCFKDCLLIFTGNEGTKELEIHGKGMGFGDPTKAERKKIDHDVVMKALEKKLRPEVRGRFSGIIVFNTLGVDEMKEIYVIELGKLQKRLEKRGFTLTVSEKMRDHIIEGLDLRYGARDLYRGISKWVEDPICEKLLTESVTGKHRVEVDFVKDEPRVTFKR